jgi:hypothetical protein
LTKEFKAAIKKIKNFIFYSSLRQDSYRKRKYSGGKQKTVQSITPYDKYDYNLGSKKD